MGLFGRNKQDEQPVIDLREQAVSFEFGYPTPCPECGEPGYLDSINTYRGVQYQHCPACMNKWQTTEAEMASR